jgi:hypothetical protein
MDCIDYCYAIIDVGPAHSLIPWCSALIQIRGKPATNPSTGIYRDTDEWHIQQSMRILTMMFLAVDEIRTQSYTRDEWREFQFYMRGKWPPHIRDMIILLAAMIGCHVPLSAVLWTRARFEPVLGLLARSYAL